MRNFEPCGHGCLRRAPFWPPPRRAAGGRGRLSPGPLQPPAPAVRRSALTRRPTGLARVARYAPKSPRVNVQRLNISFSTTISGWHCAARREASAVGGKAALRMKTATIGGPNENEAKTVMPGGQHHRRHDAPSRRRASPKTSCRPDCPTHPHAGSPCAPPAPKSPQKPPAAHRARQSPSAPGRSRPRDSGTGTG